MISSLQHRQSAYLGQRREPCSLVEKRLRYVLDV
jgi:hypothetical protein